MGTDISGWVEVRLHASSSTEAWEAVVDAGALLQRNYDLFGCLFGVKNYAHFHPLAAHRGIPDDASLTVQEDVAGWPQFVHWPTWISLTEILTIDPEEPGRYADSRLHHYDGREDGAMMTAKSFWIPSTMPPDAMVNEGELGSVPIWDDGRFCEERGRIYKAVTLRRRDAFGSDWLHLVAVMEALATRFDEAGVRLVVWFDQ